MCFLREMMLIHRRCSFFQMFFYLLKSSLKNGCVVEKHFRVIFLLGIHTRDDRLKLYIKENCAERLFILRFTVEHG